MVVALIEKLKAGTKLDNLSSVSRLKDHLSGLRIRVPALSFSIKDYLSGLWGAFWFGETLPFRFRIDGKVIKETLWARISFATLFILSDSLYLVGKSGVWIINKMVKSKGLNGWNLLMVAGCIVGFLGWVFPWWLEATQFIQDISDTQTIKVVGEIGENVEPIAIDAMSKVNVELPSLGWLAILFVAAVPFSILRFKKFQGFRTKTKKAIKPIMGDVE